MSNPLPARPPVEVNGRIYRWPARPTVVICFDGCDPSCLEAASAAGVIPTFDRLRKEGTWTTALAAMPTFTNPNNVSIVCGGPPSVHGVSGNFYIDRETGQEVMMVDATPMRAPTLLAAFSRAGASVVAVTAKDKLRKALGKDLQGIAFSAEKADTVSMSENGIDDVVGLVPDGREGDIPVIAARGVALGGRAADHDLSQLTGQRLRSHGSLDEQVVPFIISHPLGAGTTPTDPKRLRNFDIFAVVLNETEV